MEAWQPRDGWLAVSASCLVLLLCSCSAGSGHSPDPQLPEPAPTPISDEDGPLPGGLPPPSALKLNSGYEAAYFWPAANYREDWPNLQVYTYFNDIRILLYPYSYHEHSLAYACYSLNTAGLDLDNRLRVKISRTDRIWVAVADFVQDTWRWQHVRQSYSYPYHAEPQIAVATFDPETNIRSGQLPVILLACGTNTEVEWLNLHSEIPPMIDDVSIWGSKEGQFARLSPSISMGIPESMIWDFSIAGIPNHSFELEPGLILGAPGTYSCSVTASNDSGSDYYEFELTVEPQKPGALPALYVSPLQDEVKVGEEATIAVSTSMLPQDAALSYMNSVAIVVAKDACYVPGTFNTGSPGGARYDTDGCWSTLDIQPDGWIAVDDWMIRPKGVGIPGLISYEFNLTPLHGGSSTGGGVLFNLGLRFDSPGIYHLRFVEFDVDGRLRTFYSELSSVEHTWADLRNEGVPNTIRVTK